VTRLFSPSQAGHFGRQTISFTCVEGVDQIIAFAFDHLSASVFSPYNRRRALAVFERQMIVARIAQCHHHSSAVWF